MTKKQMKLFTSDRDKHADTHVSVTCYMRILCIPTGISSCLTHKKVQKKTGMDKRFFLTLGFQNCKNAPSK